MKIGLRHSFILPMLALSHVFLVNLDRAYAYQVEQKLADNKELLESVPKTLNPIAVTDTKDGADFVDKWLKSTESFNDYSFRYKMTVYRDSKTIDEGGIFWFKKPRLMRLEVTTGPKSGALVVLGPNGKVKAHMGGLMKLFVVDLSPSSDMLRSANGWPFAESDFESLAKATKNFLTAGIVSKVSNLPISVSAQSSRVYVLELYKGKLNGELYKKAYIDSKYMIPVEWFDYKDGKLFAHSVWYNFTPNQNLNDSIFTTKKRK